jgi:hypothetical protein
MPFDRGTFSITIFKLAQDLPDDAIELFNSNCAGKLDDVKDEPQIGWVSGRHLLERRIDDETAFLGGYIYLNLRTAQRKVPAALLKAESRMEELAHMKVSGNPDVPRKVKKDIKETIMENRLPQMVPTISGIPIVIDQADNTIYAGATSTRQIDTLLGFFNDTLKIAPIQMTAEEIMLEEKLNPKDFGSISLIEGETDDYSPGRDFLTWLWYFSEEEGGELDVKGYEKFAMMIDGPLSFIADGEGALETVVRKGNPLKSAEASAALNVGKKLKKAKLIFCRADEIWTAGFDADNFSFSSVSLPEGEEMDYASRFAERINNLHIFKTVFSSYCRYFIAQTKKADWPQKLQEIRNWIKNRESL